MLTGAGLGYDPRFPHSLGQQRLADTDIYLIGASMVEVLAFKVYLRTAR
jgi:hypothetical protein